MNTPDYNEDAILDSIMSELTQNEIMLCTDNILPRNALSEAQDMLRTILQQRGYTIPAEHSDSLFLTLHYANWYNLKPTERLRIVTGTLLKMGQTKEMLEDDAGAMASATLLTIMLLGDIMLDVQQTRFDYLTQTLPRKQRKIIKSIASFLKCLQKNITSTQGLQSQSRNVARAKNAMYAMILPYLAPSDRDVLCEEGLTSALQNVKDSKQCNKNTIIQVTQHMFNSGGQALLMTTIPPSNKRAALITYTMYNKTFYMPKKLCSIFYQIEQQEESGTPHQDIIQQFFASQKGVDTDKLWTMLYYSCQSYKFMRSDLSLAFDVLMLLAHHVVQSSHSHHGANTRVALGYNLIKRYYMFPREILQDFLRRTFEKTRDDIIQGKGDNMPLLVSPVLFANARVNQNVNSHTRRENADIQAFLNNSANAVMPNLVYDIEDISDRSAAEALLSHVSLPNSLEDIWLTTINAINGWENYTSQLRQQQTQNANTKQKVSQTKSRKNNKQGQRDNHPYMRKYDKERVAAFYGRKIIKKEQTVYTAFYDKLLAQHTYNKFTEQWKQWQQGAYRRLIPHVDLYQQKILSKRKSHYHVQLVMNSYALDVLRTLLVNQKSPKQIQCCSHQIEGFLPLQELMRVLVQEHPELLQTWSKSNPATILNILPPIDYPFMFSLTSYDNAAKIDIVSRCIKHFNIPKQPKAYTKIRVAKKPFVKTTQPVKLPKNIWFSFCDAENATQVTSNKLPKISTSRYVPDKLRDDKWLSNDDSCIFCNSVLWSLFFYYSPMSSTDLANIEPYIPIVELLSAIKH